MRKALFVLFVVVLVLGVAQLVSANSDIGTAYSVNSSYVQVLEPGQQPGPGTLSTYHFSGLVYPYQDPNALDYFGVQKMAEFANKNQNDFYCYANSGSYQSPGGTLWLRYAQLLKIDPASEAGTVWGFVGKVISITQLNDCFRIKLEVTEPAAYSGVIIKYYIKECCRTDS